MSTTEPLGIPHVISELYTMPRQSVTAAGFVHRVRRLGGLTFIILRDGTGLLQVVYQEKTETLKDLTPESTVTVTGLLMEEPRAPGGVELKSTTFRVLDKPEGPLPIFLGGPTLDVGLDEKLTHAPIALRHPKAQQIFRIQAYLVAGFRQSLAQRHFVEVHTPKLIAAASESGANLFSLPYFGHTAYLAQSPQLYKQIMVGVFGRVFEVGPVFRAEPHDTARHLSQYTSLDAEVGFISGPYAVMAVLRDTLAAMVQYAASRAQDIASLLPAVPEQIPTIHFREALTKLQTAFDEDVTHEEDLAPAHERWLGGWAKEEFNSDFLVVMGYPMAKRPFYTYPDPEQPAFSQSFDLLFRGQEIVTGGQRLHRYEDYLRALSERGLASRGLEAYLSTFRYGMPPHGGFAIGLERLTAQLLGLANIREATLFPRDLRRLVP